MNQNKSVVPANSAGIVTVGVPLMMADGKEYRFIWAAAWREVPVAQEKEAAEKTGGEYVYAPLVSSQLCGLEGAAKEDGKGKVFVPGELVRCWARLDNAPVNPNIYVLR